MAIYHLSATVVQRSKGHSAIAGAAYRSGTLLEDRASGKAHDYQRKRGIVESRILAPEHAPDWVYNREELWNRAERAEKRWDAQPAREIRLALPHELTERERAELVYSYVQEMFVRQGMVADISIHRPDRNGDERNHHAHILLTMRELDGDGFSARKNRDWNTTERLEQWREQWEVYQNRALEQAGVEERVDHRTLEAQGSRHEPTLHMGKDATAKERKGITTNIGDQNREIQARNEHLDALVHELAALDAQIAQAMETSFLPQEGQEPEPEPEIPITWEEEKAAAQSAFDSHIVEYYKQLIFEPGKKPEPETAMPSPLAPQESEAGLTGEEQQAATHHLFPQPEQEQQTTEIPPAQAEPSGRSWEEQKRLAQRAVEEVKRLYPLLEEAEPQQQDRSLSWEERKREAQSAIRGVERDYPVEAQQEVQVIATGLSWEEQKKAAQDVNNDSVVKGYMRDIQETGEIREYGLGHSWYERALTRLENMYADTVRYVKDMYQKHVGRHLFPSPDRDIDLDR